MSRAIPQLKSWKVTLINRDGSRSTTVVEAINKRFALWNAEVAFGPFFWNSAHIKRITIARLVA